MLICRVDVRMNPAWQVDVLVLDVIPRAFSHPGSTVGNAGESGFSRWFRYQVKLERSSSGNTHCRSFICKRKQKDSSHLTFKILKLSIYWNMLKLQVLLL